MTQALPISKPVQPARRRTASLARAIAGVFLAINLLHVLHHVMWRDEWQVWLVSLLPLGQILDYLRQAGGHPAGWFFIAWLVNKLGFYPLTLKIVHVLISSSSVYLVARFAPFTRTQKWLFALGYFPMFEYGGILRDYALEMFLDFLACVVLLSRPSRPLTLALVLAMLCQSTTFGSMFALVFWTVALLGRRDGTRAGRPTRWVAGSAIVFLGIALAFWTAKPASLSNPQPAEVPHAVPTRLGHALGDVWRALAPIPDHGMWNSNFLDAWPLLQNALGVALLLGVGFLLRRQRIALAAFALGSFILVAFCTYIEFTQLRHQGHHFLLLVIASWIFLSRSQVADSKWLRRFLTLVLCIQIPAAIWSLGRELATPFSGSLEAARVIESASTTPLPVIADRDYAACPVCGYLGRPIFLARERDFYTFTPPRAQSTFWGLSPRNLNRAIDGMCRTTKSDVIVLLNYRIDVDVAGMDIRPLRMYTPSIISDERYFIYLVKYHPARPD